MGGVHETLTLTVRLFLSSSPLFISRLLSLSLSSLLWQVRGGLPRRVLGEGRGGSHHLHPQLPPHRGTNVRMYHGATRRLDDLLEP